MSDAYVKNIAIKSRDAASESAGVDSAKEYMIYEEKMSASQLFKRLDSDHHNIKQLEDETFIYKAGDVLINGIMELPIVIQWPESVIKFEFLTSGGDIDFGILFVAALEEGQSEDDLRVETLDDVGRVPSQSEVISGEFVAPSEGVVFFVWDNKYDWFVTNKKLSYSIELFQPSFSVVENERQTLALKVLEDTIEDTETCLIRLADAEDYMDAQGPNLGVLEQQLYDLTLSYNSLVDEYNLLDAEEDRDISTVNTFYGRANGLCIRTLNKHLLAYVLSYLDVYIISDIPTSTYSGGNYIICKYWYDVIRGIRANGPVEVPETFCRPKTIIDWERINRKKNDFEDELYEDYFHDDAKSTEELAEERVARLLRSPQAAACTSEPRSPAQRSSASAETALTRDRSVKKVMQVLYEQYLRDEQAEGEGEGGDYADRAPLQVVAESPGIDSERAVSSLLYASMHPSLLRHSRMSRSEKTDLRQSGHVSAFAAAAALDEPDEPEPSTADGRSIGERAVGSEPMRVRLPKERKKPKASRLVPLQEVRSDQQMVEMLEYINAAYIKLESLSNEKRRLKKQIRSWQLSFERKYERAPTHKERKSLIRDAYEDYNRASLQVKVKKAKIEEMLAHVGVSEDDFSKLRNNGWDPDVL